MLLVSTRLCSYLKSFSTELDFLLRKHDSWLQLNVSRDKPAISKSYVKITQLKIIVMETPKETKLPFSFIRA